MNFITADPIAAFACCLITALFLIVLTLMEEWQELRSLSQLVGLNALFVYVRLRVRRLDAREILVLQGLAANRIDSSTPIVGARPFSGRRFDSRRA